MNQTEFAQLHADGVSAMRAFFLEAEKTSIMLGNGSADPLPADGRLLLITQEIKEVEAHSLYLGIKRLLHDVVQAGYESTHLDW